MNKAILLIDMPENCEDCDLFETNRMTRFLPYCYKENRTTKWKGRPDWCPLIKEPEQADIDDPIYNGLTFADGWNACIESIEEKGNKKNE